MGFAVDHFLPVPPFPELHFSNPFLPSYLPSLCLFLPARGPTPWAALAGSSWGQPMSSLLWPLPGMGDGDTQWGAVGVTHRGHAPLATSVLAAHGRAGGHGTPCPGRLGSPMLGCGAGDGYAHSWGAHPAVRRGAGAMREPGCCWSPSWLCAEWGHVPSLVTLVRVPLAQARAEHGGGWMKISPSSPKASASTAWSPPGWAPLVPPGQGKQ